MEKNYKVNRRSVCTEPNVYLLLVEEVLGRHTIVKSRFPAKVYDLVDYVLNTTPELSPKTGKVVASWHIYDGSDAFNMIDSIVDGVVGDLIATRVRTPKNSTEESVYPHCELESIIKILDIVTAGQYGREFLLSRYAEMLEDGDTDLESFVLITLECDW